MFADMKLEEVLFEVAEVTEDLWAEGRIDGDPLLCEEAEEAVDDGCYWALEEDGREKSSLILLAIVSEI